VTTEDPRLRLCHEPAPREGAAQFRVRALILPAFVPTVAFEIGTGAVIPIVALSAGQRGATASQAAVLVATLGFGRIVGDLPGAAFAARVGDKRAMVVAAIVALAAFLTCWFSQSQILLGLALATVGAATAVFYLARHSHLTRVTPVGMRARVLSSLAGSHRIGLFLGPLLGAVVIKGYGLGAAYLLAATTSLLAAALLLVLREPAGQPVGHLPLETTGGGFLPLLVRYRGVFFTVGVGVLLVAAVRAARQVVLPLWAEELQISPEHVSLIFAAAGAVEILVFYPAGRLMDRYGRLAVAMPSMIIVGVCLLGLPVTDDLTSLLALALIMSLGNGIGSGIMMTLGADAAPVDHRVGFLGVWRIFSDVGNAAGPLTVSAVAAAWALAPAVATTGMLGLMAAGMLGRYTGRYTDFATPAAVRRFRLHQANCGNSPGEHGGSSSPTGLASAKTTGT
jgi:MFS family permease